MKNLIYLTAVCFFAFTSCEDLEQYQPPDANSKPDETPPSANFAAIQNEGDGEAWKNYTFTNASRSATDYLWDFGDGNTSADFEPQHTFPGEGTFTVSLTASDALGAMDTQTQEVEVIEPEAPAVPDPFLLNADFDRLPKSSGSDCSCSGWINRSLGDQGETSSGNGAEDNLLKFDNLEPDHIYQEFEVLPNANYIVTFLAQFRGIPAGQTEATSQIEVRVLSGSGYESGYTPQYYTDTTLIPQDDFGYTSLTQIEDSSNNILTQVITNPGNTDFLTYAYAFNSGANSSLAFYMRGIGGPSTGEFGFNSGGEELRIDFIEIEADLD
jgi:PKD repeat protein